MSSPSVARRAFTEARAAVESHRPKDPNRPPALLQTLHARRHQWTAPETNNVEPRGPLVEAVRALRRGETTARGLAERSLEAWDRNKHLSSLVHLDADGALMEAENLDAGLRAGDVRGPLHGIPITVKDIIDVAGMPTRGGSATYYDLPRKDAEAIGRLREAGANILGKATTHEFALGVTTPQARNPHDEGRIPGGSSGGSAISVATGIGLASIGTDTRASIRIPPALTGTVGLRGTSGTVPTSGVMPLSWTMDTVCPITATVPDAAVLLDVLAGREPVLAGYAEAPVGGVKVGVPESGFKDCHPEVVRAVRNAISTLGSLGARVESVERPADDDFDIANRAGLILSRVEAATYHRSIGTNLEECWPETRDQLSEATGIPGYTYVEAQRCRTQLAEELLQIFDHIDVLAMPASPVPAPRVEEAEEYLTILSRNCIPWSFVGFPAISIPCRDRADGLPVGLQLVAPPHEEALLVALGSAYETATKKER